MSSIGSGIRVIVFDEHEKVSTNIRHVMFESILFFAHLPSCISFIQQNDQDKRATVVVTTKTDDRVLQAFESLEPVEAVLVLASTRKDLQSMPSKVIGIYSQFDHLLRALVETLDTLELQLDANSILFHRLKNGSENSDFYFYDLWKNHNPNMVTGKKLLVEQSRIFFRLDEQIRVHMHDFYVHYKPSTVLHWLDKYNHPFPYHLLVSNALRTHDQQILSLVRFFILDLNKQLKPIPMGSCSTQVYFGTKLPIAIVDRLEQQTGNDIVAFQCFLPTTRSRNLALQAATRSTRRQKMGNVLFKIDVSQTLVVNLSDVVLIDVATPFRITRVTRNTGFGGVQELITVVTLVAVPKKKRDEFLDHFIQKQKKSGKSIDDFIQQTIPLVRAENAPVRRNENRNHPPKQSIPMYVVSVAQADREPLSVCKDEAEGDELLSRGNWAQAGDAFDRIKDPNVRVLNKHGCLLRERLQDLQGALECHQQALNKATDRGRAETYIYLGIVRHDMEQYAEALHCYSEALKWFEDEKNRDPSMIARCLVGMGNVHWTRREFDDALDHAERALVLREQEVKPRNDFDIASCLGNIGNILHDQGDMDRALVYARRAVDILSQCAHGDRRLAAAYNNLGAMYQARGDYVKARENYEEALRVFPNQNHPYRHSTLNNLARLNALEKKESASASSQDKS